MYSNIAGASMGTSSRVAPDCRLLMAWGGGLDWGARGVWEERRALAVRPHKSNDLLDVS